MPQLEIQTFISQYLWFFGNFIIIYVLVYLKVLPNIHVRNFMINELSQAEISLASGPQKTDRGLKSFPIKINSSNIELSGPAAALNNKNFSSTANLNSSIKKEIHKIILEINYNTNNV